MAYLTYSRQRYGPSALTLGKGVGLRPTPQVRVSKGVVLGGLPKVKVSGRYGRKMILNTVTVTKPIG